MNILLILIVCAVVAGAITGARGRGQVIGFLLGLFLGPLGLLIAIVLPVDAVHAEQKQLSTGVVKKCPQCAELIKTEAKVCRFCGYALPVTKAYEVSDGFDALVSYGRQYMSKNPDERYLEGLRNNLLKRGHEADVVERVVEKVRTSQPPPR